LPVVAAPILFLVLPIIFFQVYFSLHQWTAYLGEWWQADFVGLDNFAGVFTDPRFYAALFRSLIFAGSSTILCLVIGFILAYLMRNPFPGRSLFYLLFITPMLIVPVAIGYDFEMLLVQKGPLNQLLSWISGREIQVAWFAEAVPAFVAIIFIEVWNWTPFVFILMQAGLSSMPREPIEAARVLGATPFQIFRHVEIPLLRPVIVLALILRFLEALGEYPKVWSLTRGGPGSFTETMPIYLFITSWEHFNISKGAAMSYVVLLVVAAIVYLCIRVLLREKRTLEALYGAGR
jgi:multiple sugar transport system permease protein